MISINSDNTKTSRSQSRSTSPNPIMSNNPGHARRSTADFNYPYSVSPEPSFKTKIPTPLQMPSHPFSKTSTLIVENQEKIRILQSSREKGDLEMTLQPHTKDNRCSLNSANISITPKFKKGLMPSNLCTSEESVQSSMVLSSENSFNLNICSCIVKGSIYRHYEDCEKITVTALISGLQDARCCNKKKIGVIEACVIIQRAVRNFLEKKNFFGSSEPTERSSINVSNYNYFSHQSSVSQHQDNLNSTSDIENATKSLFQAIEQLKSLKLSQGKSPLTLLNLQESLISNQLNQTPMSIQSSCASKDSGLYYNPSPILTEESVQKNAEKSKKGEKTKDLD